MYVEDRQTHPGPNDSDLKWNKPTSYVHCIGDVGKISKWKRMIKTSPKESSKTFHQIWRPKICTLFCRHLSFAPPSRKVSLGSSYLPGIPNISTSAPEVPELQEYSSTHSLLWQFWTTYFTTNLLKIGKLKKGTLSLSNFDERVCISCMYILGKQMHPLCFHCKIINLLYHFFRPFLTAPFICEKLCGMYMYTLQI